MEAVPGFRKQSLAPRAKERIPGARVAHALRQIVAERGQEHVVDSVRRDFDRGRGSTRPCVSDQVGILRAELYSSLGTVVHTEPEPERALDSALSIAAARKPSESVTAVCSGRGFRIAIPVA